MPDLDLKAIKMMEKTIEDIQEAVKQLTLENVTKEDVLSLIKDRSEENKDLITNDLNELKEKFEELSSTAGDMQAKIRTAARNAYTIAGGRKSYNGVFSSREEAKAIGLSMMLAGLHSVKDKHGLQDRYDRILECLKDLGHEPVYVDEKGIRAKAATTTGQTTGAVLIGDQTPGLIMLLEKYGKARANGMPVPLGPTTTPVPKITSLLTVYVPGEGNAPTLDDLIAGMVTMTPKTMTVLAAYSIELDEDSAVGLAELYGDLMARSLAYYEDLCAFLGDGTSTYFGFKGIAGALRAVDATIGNIKSLVVAAGNAYSEITLANFESVVGTLPEYADDSNAKWYVHKYFYWTVMVPLALGATGATATEIVQGAGLALRRIFLGYDVEYVQVMPKAEANNQICALLANLRMGLMFGTRGGVEIAQSDQRYFDQGLIAIRVRSRADINAHGVGDTTNAGPIVGLITAGS